MAGTSIYRICGTKPHIRMDSDYIFWQCVDMNLNCGRGHSPSNAYQEMVRNIADHEAYLKAEKRWYHRLLP